MAETTVNNGVNVEALLAAREALKSAPEAAKFKWRASCKWQNGTHSETKIEGFTGSGRNRSTGPFSFDADHPEIFASEDHGITPVEFMLVGLASCLTAGVAAVAQNRGIQLRSVEARVEGSMDIQGILGIDSEVRNGYDDIKVTFNIDADAPRKDIEALVAQSQKRSAVYDAITNPTNVTVEVAQRRGRPARSRIIERVTTVVIGAGHAGLAASRFLTDRSIDHVVLERGEVANSWRQERWDSLRLLTPNWLTRLPGCRYDGADPDGFMGMGEVIAFISRYATLSRAPVRPHTTVTSVRQVDGYHVATDAGVFHCRAVVLATGACNLPSVPALRQGVPASIESLTPSTIAIPISCPTAACSSSARPRPACSSPMRSGAQGAASCFRSASTSGCRGRIEVATSCGGWTRSASGISAMTSSTISSAHDGCPRRSWWAPRTRDARPQCVEHIGVELVGRLSAVRDGRALFSGGLRNQFALADLKMDRLLDTFDAWADTAPATSMPVRPSASSPRARRPRRASTSISPAERFAR